MNVVQRTIGTISQKGWLTQTLNSHRRFNVNLIGVDKNLTSLNIATGSILRASLDDQEATTCRGPVLSIATGIQITTVRCGEGVCHPLRQIQSAK